MSSRKSAAAGQSTRRLVQPSIGVRLFMTQRSGARGRAGGTSDHFHPSVRRHRERHKQKSSQFLRKVFLQDTVCAPSCTEFYFQCRWEHLACYFTPLSEVKRLWIQMTAKGVYEKRCREDKQGGQDPKFMNLVMVLCVLQTPNLLFFFLFFLDGPSDEQLRPTTQFYSEKV